MTELKVGDTAPDFELPAVPLGMVKLSDFAGKIVILYFYPKDDTTGCTAEAIAFTNLLPRFEAAGATVIGVSPDSVTKHERFSIKHNLKVILASDEKQAVASVYGVWKEKSMYGRTYMGVERTTFLIGPDRKLLRIWPKVKVAGHAEEVLQALAV
ncbi:MAG TPA: peroxiredoxin [Pseudorhizobium sp.]|jgi:peroxiredoxin Q/BCP|nr:peroxiredoxin [Pseudorhizobium sp.]